MRIILGSLLGLFLVGCGKRTVTNYVNEPSPVPSVSVYVECFKPNGQLYYSGTDLSFNSRRGTCHVTIIE
jgi:hypothetical protein